MLLGAASVPWIIDAVPASFDPLAYFLAIIPPFALLMIFTGAHYNATVGQYATQGWANAFQTSYPSGFGPSVGGIGVMMVFSAILWGLLVIYADKVLPNEYDTHLHPLFFLGLKRRVHKDKSYDDGAEAPVDADPTNHAKGARRLVEIKV